ncbi:MAG TPA: 30S ribosomal protein S16 [Myxococcota bacterium]|nr:30S ribosomal protein S16 [Myxococcota bacterium]
MVKIRLSRAGAKKRPYYHIVAIDGRARRDGRPLDTLGTYNPITRPKQIEIDTARLDAWVKRGAQVSDAVTALAREARRRSVATS